MLKRSCRVGLSFGFTRARMVDRWSWSHPRSFADHSLLPYVLPGRDEKMILWAFRGHNSRNLYSHCVSLAACAYCCAYRASLSLLCQASVIPNVPELSYFSPNSIMDDVASPSDSMIVDLPRGFGRFEIGLLYGSPFFNKLSKQ